MTSKISADKYQDILNSCANWNRQMLEDAQTHVPFLDTQTNIAQRPGNPARTIDDRVEENAENDSAIYIRYEAQPYQRPKTDTGNRLHFGDIYKRKADRDAAIQAQQEAALMGNHLTAQMNSDRAGTESRNEYNEYDEFSNDSDDPPIDDSDGDDYVVSRKRKKKSTPAVKRGSRPQRNATRPNYNEQSTPLPASFQRTPVPPTHTPTATPAATPQQQMPPSDYKPYSCHLCGARYKSKPGLAYHNDHVHPELKAQHKDSNTSQQGDASNMSADSSTLSAAAAPNDYCDFCLGAAGECRKNNAAEDLIACHDCGRAGHPTCLNFTSNMLVSTRKYGWQCIECKSCAICGTSDNDHVLLFCDDCDRGFHLYCLNPPLQAAPEGEWSCHLCQMAFGGKASHPASKIDTKIAQQ